MDTYRAFGLTLKSELSLPCLPASGAEEPGVEIGYGPVGENGLENPAASGPYFQSGPDQVWLGIPRVGRFLITGGDRIRIDPEPGADAQSLRLFVLGSCIGAILHQRGRLVLHGSALRFGEGCAAFLGDSGAGKSTTAAALRLRGHGILADDIAAIDDGNRVQAGFPQLKLWADTARRMGLDIGALARIRPQADKYAFPVESGFCEVPLPLTTVFVLRTHEKPELVIEPVRGMEKLELLRRHTYRFEYLRGMGLQGRHLMQCSRLAGLVRMIAVTRPLSGMPLEPWLKRLQEHLPRVSGTGAWTRTPSLSHN